MFPLPIPNECPDWQEGKACTMCQVQFSQTKRASHCRSCGFIFCRTHCSQTALLPQYGLERLHKVCDECVDRINEIESMMHKRRNYRSSYLYGSVGSSGKSGMTSPRKHVSSNGTRAYRTQSGLPVGYDGGGSEASDDVAPGTPPLKGLSTPSFNSPSRSSSLFPNSSIFNRSSVSALPRSPIATSDPVFLIPKSHDLMVSALNSAEAYSSWLEGADQLRPDPRNAFAKKHPSKDIRKQFQLTSKPRIGYILRLLLTPFSLNAENTQLYSIFFLTHSLFITSKSLALFLLTMLTLPADRYVNDRRFLSTQTTALSLFQFWMKCHPEDLLQTQACIKFALNPLFVNKIKQSCAKHAEADRPLYMETRRCIRLYGTLKRVFIDSGRYQATTNGHAHVLARLHLLSRTQETVPSIAQLMPKLPGSIPPLPHSAALSPNLMAHVLTVQHARLFSQVSPREAVLDSWGRHSKYYNTVIQKLHSQQQATGLKSTLIAHDLMDKIVEEHVDWHDPLYVGSSDNSNLQDQSPPPPLGLYHFDNGLVRLIQNFNRTALWVASCVLFADDSKLLDQPAEEEDWWSRVSEVDIRVSHAGSGLADTLVLNDNTVIVEDQAMEEISGKFTSAHQRTFCSFVMTAYDLYLQFNYYGVSAVFSGLQQSSIRRLPLWDMSSSLTVTQLSKELNIDVFAVRYGKRGSRPNQLNPDMTVGEIQEILQSVTSNDKNFAKYRSHWEYACQAYQLELDALEDIKLCGCRARSTEIDVLTQAQSDMVKQKVGSSEEGEETKRAEIIGYFNCSCSGNHVNNNNVGTWLSGHLPLPLPLLPCVLKDLYTCTEVRSTVPINLFSKIQEQYGEKVASNTVSDSITNDTSADTNNVIADIITNNPHSANTTSNPMIGSVDSMDSRRSQVRSYSVLTSGSNESSIVFGSPPVGNSFPNQGLASVDYGDNVDVDLVVVDTDWDNDTTQSRERGKVVFMNLRDSSSRDEIVFDVPDENTGNQNHSNINEENSVLHRASPKRQQTPCLADSFSLEFSWSGMVRQFSCVKPQMTAIHACQRHGLGYAQDAGRAGLADFLFPDTRQTDDDEHEVQVLGTCVQLGCTSFDCLCKHQSLSSGPGDCGQTSIVAIGCDSKFNDRIDLKPTELEGDNTMEYLLMDMHVAPARGSAHPAAQRMGELAYSILYTVEETVAAASQFIPLWRTAILPPFLAPQPQSSVGFLPRSIQASSVCQCGSLVESHQPLHQGVTDTVMCGTCIQQNAEHGNIAVLEQMIGKTIEFQRNDDTLWNQSIL